MKEEPNNFCKERRIIHAWKDITPNIVCATNPPQYPPKQEQCLNCGLVRTHYEQTEKWVEYELREKTKYTGITIDDSGDIVTHNPGTITIINL